MIDLSNETMIHIKDGDIEYLQFRKLLDYQDKIQHCYTLNEDEEVDKQDCELKAFKRLAEKIKKEYPRLRIIISGDALYASKPVIETCKEKT